MSGPRLGRGKAAALVHRWAELPGRQNHGDRPPFHLVSVMHNSYVEAELNSHPRVVLVRGRRFVCLRRVYRVCAGHQPYVTAFRQQHSRRLRRHTNRTDQSRSGRFWNKQRGRPQLAAQPVHQHGRRFRRHCYHPTRLAHDERPRMVELGPSRAEHETGGEAISAETISRPPRHP
jgi:hypothetical protein